MSGVCFFFTFYLELSFRYYMQFILINYQSVIKYFIKCHAFNYFSCIFVSSNNNDMKAIAPLTAENASKVSTVINNQNPEWGSFRFRYKAQQLVNDACDVIGSDSNSKVLFEDEYKFWSVPHLKNKQWQKRDQTAERTTKASLRKRKLNAGTRCA